MVNETRFLSQRFSNTIIARKGTLNKNTPVRVRDFSYNTDRGYIEIIYQHLEDDDVITKRFVEEEYILDCPRIGMVFDGKSTVYLHRIPDRQWKRGYNSNIVRLEIISKESHNELRLERPHKMSNLILKFIYNQDFMPFNKGLEKMEKNEIFNFPFSMKYAISREIGKKFPVVYYKTWRVGWVEDRCVCLPEGAHHLFEEISQYAQSRRV